MIKMTFLALILSLGSFACGSDDTGSPGTGADASPGADGGGGSGGSTINNGHLTLDEACDLDKFATLIGSTCTEAADSDLTTGALLCTAMGTISFENCTEPDVCLLSGIRDIEDGCDPCEQWAGTATVPPDTDCDACVADGFCADRWDTFAQGWVCELTKGMWDPDCPVCGNGTRDTSGFSGGGEQCDGEDFGPTTCKNLGYTSGTLTCKNNCRIDHSECIR